VFVSDGEIPSPGQSPKYKESNVSTSATDSDDGGGGGDGGSQYRVEPSGGGTQFIGEKHKLCYICAPSFSYMTNAAPFFVGEADFTHAT
jgi:hypothetical protein